MLGKYNFSKLSYNDIMYLKKFQNVLIKTILFSFIMLFIIFNAVVQLVEVDNIYVFIFISTAVAFTSFFYGKYLMKYIKTYKRMRIIIDKTKVNK